MRTEQIIKKFAWSFFFLTFSFGSWSTTVLAEEPYSHAYLALAGPGPGLGMMGHAYVVFTKEPGELFGGIAYQYNVLLNKVVDPSASTLDKLKLAMSSPFLVTRLASSEMVQNYQNQDRTQLLFKIQFPVDKIHQLQDLLEKDLQKRLDEQPIDYSLLWNNCLTRFIFTINSLIDSPADKIPVFWTEGKGIDLTEIFSREALVGNVPMFSSLAFKENPYISETPLIIRPSIYLTIEMNRAFLRSFDALQKLCSWPSAMHDTSSKILASPALRNTETFIRYLDTKITECQDGISKDEAEALPLQKERRKLFALFLAETKDTPLFSVALEVLSANRR